MIRRRATADRAKLISAGMNKTQGMATTTRSSAVGADSTFTLRVSIVNSALRSKIRSPIVTERLRAATILPRTSIGQDITTKRTRATATEKT